MTQQTNTDSLDDLVASLTTIASESRKVRLAKKNISTSTEVDDGVLPEHYINGNRRGLDAPAGYAAAQKRALLVKLIGSDESFRREAISLDIIIVEQPCSTCDAVHEYIGGEMVHTYARSNGLHAWVRPGEVPPSEKKDLPIHTKRIRSPAVEYCPQCAEEVSAAASEVPFNQYDLFVLDEEDRAKQARATAEAAMLKKLDKMFNKMFN